MSTPADDPSDLSPAQAAEYWLGSHDGSAETVRGYGSQVRQFIAWCEREGIDTVGDLSGWHIDQFRRERASELKPVSLQGQMSALRQFAKYLEQIEAVETGFHERIPTVSVDATEETSDVMLDAEEATALLDHYRDSPLYGTTGHTILELLWNTGARLGAIHGLDRGDVDLEEGHATLRHRPQTETPLKNNSDGERVVALPETVVDVLEWYCTRERRDLHDDAGRAPLLTTQVGRMSSSEIRAQCYLATHPCVYRPCPHGNERATCEYRERGQAGGCPSARAPHHIRTGAITWMLNQGIPVSVVAERVNASPDTIKRYYDKAIEIEKMQERRSKYTEGLDIDS